MREMIYQKERLNPPERIADGRHKGFDFYVLNLGTHPCAYIDVSDTSLYGVDYSNIDINCHFGLTYSYRFLATVDKRGWFIGWDYAHYTDYSGYDINSLYSLTSNGKKWTTEEIVNECKEVIEQLIELLKGGVKK